MSKSYAPLRRQLVQPAADDGRGSLVQGGVAGVGRDGQVVVCLGEEGVGGQRGAAGRGRSFTDGAVTLSVYGMKRLREPLGPGELLTPAGGNKDGPESGSDPVYLSEP